MARFEYEAVSATTTQQIKNGPMRQLDFKRRIFDFTLKCVRFSYRLPTE